MAATVLVVEDERKLRELVRSYLERAGFTVLTTDSGAEALALAGSAAPDLVILDLGLPDVRGRDRGPRAAYVRPYADPDAHRQEHRGSRNPRSGTRRRRLRDQAVPPRELVLRVQAVLRRGGPAAAGQEARYGGGALVIDEPQRQVTVRGAVVGLTPTEWGLLLALATVPGRVYSRFELINRVRGYEFEGYERTVNSRVKNLRRKIEEDPGDPQIVQTVLGGGYRLGLARDAGLCGVATSQPPAAVARRPE